MTGKQQEKPDPRQSPLIRPISPDDAGQLRKLYALSLGLNRDGFVQRPDFHGDIYDRALKYADENGEMLGMFTLDGNEMIGMGGLKRKGPDRAELCNLHLHPGYQGQGHGKRLAYALLDDAKLFGYGIVELHVTATQENAIGLYRRIGFVETKRQVYEVEGATYDTIFMEYLL